MASSASHISWAPKFVYDVMENAHNAAGHGIQRKRLQVHAKELEEQAEDEAFPVYSSDDDNHGGNSSKSSLTSGSRSRTDSSTDEDSGEKPSKVREKFQAEYVTESNFPAPVPFANETELQRVEDPPPPTTLLSTWYAFLEVVDWDKENRRVMKLALPYLIQAFITGIAEAARVAIIGKYYGTRALSAYVVIDMTVGLTAEFFGGITDATGLLATTSIGAGTNRLTGQYFTIGLILYILIVTPFTVAWVFAAEGLLDFFGFDQETVSTEYG